MASKAPRCLPSLRRRFAAGLDVRFAVGLCIRNAAGLGARADVGFGVRVPNAHDVYIADCLVLRGPDEPGVRKSADFAAGL